MSHSLKQIRNQQIEAENRTNERNERTDCRSTREFAVFTGVECDIKDKWMSVMKEDICLDMDREGDEEN